MCQVPQTYNYSTEDLALAQEITKKDPSALASCLELLGEGAWHEDML